MAVDETPSYQELLELMRSRRSVRRFSNEPVADELVEQLVEAARWAPSAGNQQAWRVLYVDDRERIGAMGDAVRARVEEVRSDLRPSATAQMSGYLDSFLTFTGAPIVLAFIHRAGVDLIQAARRSREKTTGVEPEAYSLASAAAAIENLLIAAHALGLGACWMTGPLLAEQEMSSILKVPRSWRLTALIPVGWPAEAPQPPPRRSLERLLRRVG